MGKEGCAYKNVKFSAPRVGSKHHKQCLKN